MGHVDPGSYRPRHQTTRNPAQRRPEMARFRRSRARHGNGSFHDFGTGVVAIASPSNRAPTDRRRVMRFTGRRLRTALALATLCVGIGSTSAMAQPPAWETIAVDETYLLPRTSATCGFEVYKHDFGTLEVQTVVLPDGGVRIHDVAVRIDSVISAPSTGQSVLVHPGGTGGRSVTLHPDGSVTVSRARNRRHDHGARRRARLRLKRHGPNRD